MEITGWQDIEQGSNLVRAILVRIASQPRHVTTGVGIR